MYYNLNQVLFSTALYMLTLPLYANATSVLPILFCYNGSFEELK